MVVGHVFDKGILFIGFLYVLQVLLNPVKHCPMGLPPVGVVADLAINSVGNIPVPTVAWLVLVDLATFPPSEILPPRGCV